jgi:biopolymer transport protein ExbB
MDLVAIFKDFALLGADWVLYLLVALSVLSVGVMIERGLYFNARRIDTDRLVADAKTALAGGDVAAFEKRYKDAAALPARVAVRGIAERAGGVDAVAEVMNSEKTRGRQDAERSLIVLGTLGNNAPFIGLFGTVLGIIKAFEDLRTGGATTDTTELVMRGISEALVATAIGLLVAIPAVIAFNYLTRRVRSWVTASDEVAHAILGAMYGNAHAARAAGGGEA